MELAFLRGAILGFAICIPIGPVNVAVIDTAIRRTLFLAVLIGIGGALIDFAYSQLAVSGLGALLEKAPTLSNVFQVAGGVVLVGYGAVVLGRAPAEAPKATSQPPKTKAALAALGTGISLMVLNPAAIVSWLFLAGIFLADLGRVHSLVCGVGIFLGATAWFCLVAWLAHRGRVRLGARAVWITRTVAILLIGYGVFLLGKTGLAMASVH